MKHVMVDIETLGTGPDAVIASIGAVAFDENAVTSEFEVTVNIASQLTSTRPGTVSGDTIAWWMQQSKDAQLATFPLEQNKLPAIYEALQSFAEWAADEFAERFWSHGATFDLVVMNAANERTNGGPLFSDFRQLRDTRTLYEIADVNPKTFMGDGTAHRAVDDARAQALAVIASWRKISEWRKPVVHMAYLEKGPFKLEDIREREAPQD